VQPSSCVRACVAADEGRARRLTAAQPPLHAPGLLPQWAYVQAGGWPFQRLADQLCCDVLSPMWAVRHGAAAGLREVLREQAAAAAVEAPVADVSSGWVAGPGGGAWSVFLLQQSLQHHLGMGTHIVTYTTPRCPRAGRRKLGGVAAAQAEAAAAANASWLEGVIMHLLAVLALDRFADYVSDQVCVCVCVLCGVDGRALDAWQRRRASCALWVSLLTPRAAWVAARAAGGRACAGDGSAGAGGSTAAHIPGYPAARAAAARWHAQAQ
jgi:hypothetical protein